MFDLLAPQPFLERSDGTTQMSIGEDENGVYVKNLSSHIAKNEEEALNLLFEVFIKTKMFSRRKCSMWKTEFNLHEIMCNKILVLILLVADFFSDL